MDLISVIVPCFNEALVLRETHQRLKKALATLPEAEHEIVYVDDGSTDETFSLLKELQQDDPAVRVLRFSRNFGHQVAITAGMEAATGQAVAVMDADLQDPPEVLADMVARWREGYHVVYGTRTMRRGEGRFKLITAKLYYRLLSRLSNVKIPLDAGDFRLMDRRVVDVVTAMPEKDRFVRGLVSWAGFRQVSVPYQRDARRAGETKYPLRKMLRFAMDGFLSFSTAPLRLATAMGFAAALLSVLGILYAFIMRLFTPIWVSGWTLMFMAMCFLGGVQLICLGIIGEYIGRSYMESKRRPLYVLQDKLGFPDQASQDDKSDEGDKGDQAHD